MRPFLFFLPLVLLGCGQNLPPLLEDFTASSNNVNPCQTVNLSVKASDPEKARLKYTFAMSPKIGELSSSGNSASWLLSPTVTNNSSVIFVATISDGNNVIQSNPIRVNLVAAATAKNCASIAGVVRPAVQFATTLPEYEHAIMRPGEAIVQFRNTSTPAQVTARLQNTPDLQITDWISNNTAIIKSVQAQARIQGSAVARVQGIEAETTLQFVQQLRTRTDVIYAEPNTILKLQNVPTPNDPLYAQQWHYTALALPAAWNQFSSEADVGAGVTVAVLDSGILWDSTDPAKRHPDFNCEVAPNKPKILPGYDFLQGDNNPFDTDTIVGFHGTHVAGTVGACTNNAAGVAGVAWKSQILPIRALSSTEGDIGKIAKAMYWAAGISTSPLGAIPPNPNPANIINMSLGGEQSPSPTLQAAVDAVNAQGVVVVVAAGNSNIDAAKFTPANLQGVITVGALGPTKARASYSDYGSSVAIVAPGGDFAIQRKIEDGVLSTLGCGTGNVGQFNSPLGGTIPPCTSWGYGSYHGTSMASPHIAGLVALMMSRNAALRGTDPNNWVRIRSYLMDSSSLTGLVNCEQGCGAGLVSADTALQKATSLPNIGAVIVRSDPSEITLGTSQTQSTFTIKNIGDAAANISVTAAGTGLSATPNTINLAVNQTQVISVSLNRSNLNGIFAGKISLQYGTRNLEQRVYYEQGNNVLTNPAGYFLRIYKVENSNKRTRLNYPDTPVQANGAFAFDDLATGTYDITVYREKTVNADGTITISEIGQRLGTYVYDSVVSSEINLENTSQVICSREGSVAAGPTKCPG